MRRLLLLPYFRVWPCPRPSRAPQSHPEDTGIIRHLNSAITWYKELTTVNESAGEPSDAFYLDNARALATQVLQLAFQSADAEAALLSTEEAEGAGGGGQPLEASQDQQNWAKSAANIAAQISQEQSQIDMLNSQIPKTSGKKQQALISQRDSLQEQLDFNKVLQEALQKLSSFMWGQTAPGVVALASRGFTNPVNYRLLAHEISHLWWRCLVSPATPNDAFLDEGLAEYSKAMYVQESAGDAAFEDLMRETAVGALYPRRSCAHRPSRTTARVHP